MTEHRRRTRILATLGPNSAVISTTAPTRNWSPNRTSVDACPVWSVLGGREVTTAFSSLAAVALSPVKRSISPWAHCRAGGWVGLAVVAVSRPFLKA